MRSLHAFHLDTVNFQVDLSWFQAQPSWLPQTTVCLLTSSRWVSPWKIPGSQMTLVLMGLSALLWKVGHEPQGFSKNVLSASVHGISEHKRNLRKIMKSQWFAFEFERPTKMLHCAHPNVFVEADMYSQRGTLSIDLVNKTNLGVCVCVVCVVF